MSDYGTVSDPFKESLAKHLDPVVEKQAQCVPMMDGGPEAEADNIAWNASSFIQRVIKDWVLMMEDSSKQEVNALFEELKGVSTTEFLSSIIDGSHTSPFALLAQSFESAHPEGDCHEEEIVEIIEPAAEAG
jgi:hypothetical protein